MFSSLFYNIFETLIFLTQKFGATPFLWDRRKKCLHTTKRSILKCWCQITVIFIHTGWFFVRIVQTKVTGANLEDYPFTVAFFLFFLFVIPGHVPYLVDPEFSAFNVNAMLYFTRKFHSKSLSIIIASRVVAHKNSFLVKFICE